MPTGRPLIDPTSGKPFPTNAQGQFLIPTTRFNPVAARVMNTWLPLPNEANGGLEQLGKNPISNNQFLVKLDYVFNSQNTLNFMWMRDRTTSTNPFFNSTILGYAPDSPFTHINVFVLNDTHAFRPNVLNELRGAYTRLLDTLACGPQLTASQLGIQNFIPDGPAELPDFVVPGQFTLASAGLCNLSEGTPTKQISDTFTWIKGNHQLKMGGDWFGNAEQITAYSLNSGRFSFSGGASGNSLADFLLGQVAQYQRQTGGPAHLHSFEWGAFFSDDWKVTRRFTFNLGLRYFIQTPWVADWGGPNGLIPDGVATFIPGYKSKRWANIPPGVLFPADNGPNGTIPRGLYPTPYNNWEPQFGFAFDPGGDGKTSIRGSFGIFHDIIIPDVVAQAGSVQPYVYREVFNSPAGGLSNAYQGFANPWPYTAFLSSNPPFYLPATAASLDRHTTNPNVQSWSLDVQRQLLSNFLIEAAYVGKATRHLILITDGNPSVYLPGANAQGNPLSTAQNIDARRIFAPTWVMADSSRANPAALPCCLTSSSRRKPAHPQRETPISTTVIPPKISSPSFRSTISECRNASGSKVPKAAERPLIAAFDTAKPNLWIATPLPN